MRRERHFEKIVGRENDERDGIAALLESLRRSAVALEASIEDEGQLAGRGDPSHYAYPIAAKAMAQRRDNLNTTIAALKQRLIGV